MPSHGDAGLFVRYTLIMGLEGRLFGADITANGAFYSNLRLRP